MLRVLAIGLGLSVAVVLGEVAARLAGLGDPVLYYNAAWGGMRPLPDQRVKRLRGATVTVDANGFRTPNPPPEQGLHILYLGDSVVWGGSRIDDDELFSEVAAQALEERGVHVYSMNAGVNGTGLMNQADVFHGATMRVDALVWLFPWGDVYRGYKTVGYLWPARYKPRLALVELADHAIRGLWNDRLRHGPPRSPEPWEPPAAAPGYEAFLQRAYALRKERNLDALRAGVARALERGIPVIVGITPYVDDGVAVPAAAEATGVLAELERLGARVFDVREALLGATADPASLYLDRVHLNRAGHRRLGVTLGDVLAESIPGSAVATRS